MPRAPQSFAGTSRWCYCFALNLTPTTTSLAETTICAIKSTREVLNTVKCIDCHAAGIFTWFNVTICHIIKHDLSNKSCWFFKLSLFLHVLHWWSVNLTCKVLFLPEYYCRFSSEAILYLIFFLLFLNIPNYKRFVSNTLKQCCDSC